MDELQTGMEASAQRTISEADIAAFAAVSGDDNPMHMDKVYASRGLFKQRVAHGLFTASLLSALLGGRLPGAGCVYLSQTLTFKAPVFIGDTVCSLVKVTSLDRRRNIATLATSCTVNGRSVLEGEARVLVATARPPAPARPLAP